MGKCLNCGETLPFISPAVLLVSQYLVGIISMLNIHQYDNDTIDTLLIMLSRLLKGILLDTMLLTGVSRGIRYHLLHEILHTVSKT